MAARTLLRRLTLNRTVFNTVSRNVSLNRSLNQTQKFTTYPRALSSSGLTDTDLAHSLNTELKFEEEEGDYELSDNLKEYIEKSHFKVKEVSGEDEVRLVRTFGNEKVEVTFSIKDNELIDPEVESDEVANEEENIPNPPIRATIDITKATGGTLTFETIIQDGYFNIELVTHYKDSKLAVEDSAEGEWKRHALYAGPVFNDLEEDLQIQFERYLEERGITTDLAMFIPSYIQFKEQKEYMNWLKKVHDFVKA